MRVHGRILRSLFTVVFLFTLVFFVAVASSGAGRQTEL
jgi:hypothetical protein